MMNDTCHRGIYIHINLWKLGVPTLQVPATRAHSLNAEPNLTSNHIIRMVSSISRGFLH